MNLCCGRSVVVWVKEFVLRTFGSCVGKGICVADVRRDLEETGNYLRNSE